MANDHTPVQPTRTAVQIVSFGYLHGPLLDGNGGPLPVDLVVDLRRHFRDPHVDPALRQLTALDDAVRTAVRNTPGITDLVAMLTGAVLAYRSGPSAHRHPVTVATGCAGGRHRAGSVALELAAALREHGVSSSVIHRDLHRPVVDR
ncbi:ATPase [Streptomyces sp. NPDC060366]|uniref:RapZ C-terminal domain-containing protein n=1 Tax=Streptomyces sp. NPDC060366 TaxID=3347105 RepID=UPI003651B5CA